MFVTLFFSFLYLFNIPVALIMSFTKVTVQYSAVNVVFW